VGEARREEEEEGEEREEAAVEKSPNFSIASYSVPH
jgi:hypothetical protein